MKEAFGKVLRELRLHADFTLRGFAKEIGMKPSNLSYIETGRTNPPRDKATLYKMAESLGLKKGSKEWGDFFDSAADKPDRLPADIAENEDIRDYLPIMLRTVANSKVSKKEIMSLIAELRKR